MKMMPTKHGDFRGKRAELNVYDDAMDDLVPIDYQGIVYLNKGDTIPTELMDKLIQFEKSFNMEYMINKSHKDEDGTTVIDDFRIIGMSVVED